MSTLETCCIVIPTLNEAKNVSKLIPQIFNYQDEITSHELHVLIVDGNSSDGTQDVVNRLKQEFKQLHLITCEKRGLGEAYKAGFKTAFETLNPELIFEMDADGQHDPKMIPIFITLISYGFDCIIGSRFASGGQLINFSFKRRLISKVGNFLIRVIGGIPNILDCTSGYRCIKSSFIKKCSYENLLTSGYAFQSSLISELVRNDTKILEFPIIFNERNFGESKLRLIDQIDFLINLFFIRVNKSFLFFKYGIIGLSGIFINLGTYVILTRYINLDYNLAVILAIETSIVTNFFGHHFFTFKQNEVVNKSISKRFIQYHFSVLISSAIQFSVFFVCFNIAQIADIFSNIIGILNGFLANYILNTQYTWKRKRNEKG